MSPDGKSVYVTSVARNSISHFSRELAAVPPPPGTPPAPDAPPPPTSELAREPSPAGTPPDTLAPSISRLRLNNRRFRVGSGATLLAARRVPVGTTFRYMLSEPATVTVAIERAVAGGRTRDRCLEPRRRRHRRPACTRWVSAGRTLARTASTGRNSLFFRGRIGRQELRPGAYRARFDATDTAGNRSRGANVRFGIAR